MKKKALIVATVAGFITSFEMNDVKILQELGYDVIIAANFEKYNGKLDNMNVEKLNIGFARSPFSMKNLKAFKELNKFVKENKIDLIHCHTPVGGVMGRVVGKLNKVKTVIYTAHGFHFFDGAPKINWMIFYPVEKFLSRFTDVLITINHEDYERASKKFYAKKVEYIPGVGIDTEKIRNVQINRDKAREKLGVKKEDIVLLSVGELNPRKNHEVVINALGNLQNKNIYYFIAGTGFFKVELENLIKKYNLENNVKLLGYRTDVYELYKAVDICVFPSQREGLGLAGLEGMASGLPLISSYINGIKDYTQNGKTGICVDRFDVEGFKTAIEKLAQNKDLRKKMGNYNQKVVKKFDLKETDKAMRKIYKNIND